MDTIVRKINNQEITSSKDVRQLRNVLRDPVAKKEFMSPTGSVESALPKIPATSTKRPQGLVGDLDELPQAIPPLSVDRIDRDEGRPRSRQEGRRS